MPWASIGEGVSHDVLKRPSAGLESRGSLLQIDAKMSY